MNATVVLRRAAALAIAALVFWFIVGPNWTTSGASTLDEALTDPSFWVFWVGTAITLAGVAYAIAGLTSRKAIGAGFFLSGLCLLVNAGLTRNPVEMGIPAVVALLVGGAIYWGWFNKAAEPTPVKPSVSRSRSA